GSHSGAAGSGPGAHAVPGLMTIKRQTDGAGVGPGRSTSGSRHRSLAWLVLPWRPQVGEALAAVTCLVLGTAYGTRRKLKDFWRVRKPLIPSRESDAPKRATMGFSAAGWLAPGHPAV